LHSPLSSKPDSRRPGDNPNQCAQGYSCPPPTLAFDPYLPTGNRYFEVGAGGSAEFSFVVATNASWLKFDTTKASISPSHPEQRIYASVDWSKITGTGTQVTTIQIIATVPGQPDQSFTFYADATKTTAPADFRGFVEGDGGISIEANHASRNTSVDEVAWKVLPNIGRTLDGVTPWPRLGNNGRNYTAGEGPSLYVFFLPSFMFATRIRLTYHHSEYDFYNFKTMPGNRVLVTAYVSPSLNSNAPDRRIGLALQIDSGKPSTSYFIPPDVAGNLPAAWDGPDGFVANNVVAVTANLIAAPGKHTLKVWMIEPAVVVQKLVVNTGGILPSYLGPPESVRI
jgi:hypothetical protein